MKKQAFILFAILACALFPQPVQAQIELLLNGDFEDLALDENDMPLLDDYGNAFPSSWFRNVNGDPSIPKTELIGPINGDPADDSDGMGTNAVALNPQTSGYDPHSDWRSETFEVTPGEVLSLSFDFKFIDVVSFPEFQQFRLDLRAFTDPEAVTFVNEVQMYVSPVGYRLSPPDSVLTAADYTDENWHTLTFDWIVPEGPGGPEVNLFSDVRVTINAFTNLVEGQVRLDNFSVTRPSTTTGDYNGDGTVNAADYTVWRDMLGQTVENPGDEADGDSSGEVDVGDYTFWKSRFGDVIAPGGGSLSVASNVPEPTVWHLILSAAACFSIRRKSRLSNTRD